MKQAARHNVGLRASLLLLSAAAAVVALSVTASAAPAPAPRRDATVAEYRERVQDALDEVEGMVDYTDEVDSESDSESLAYVREKLPRGERVARAGGPVEADNVWLHDALAEYERTAGEKTAGERAESLRAIAARLRALDARLAEADGAAPARDKDAEKGRLNTILRRPEYVRPEKQEGNALERQLKRFSEWLRGLLPSFGPLRSGSGGGLSVAAQIFIFTLAGLVLAYVLWQLFRRLGGGPKPVTRGARVVLGERLEADQTAADLLAEAERLAREGQLRAAIRKAYVALLCELGDRKVIGLAQHKTNRDYLQAVRQRAPRLYPEMLPLTFDFELHWYGAQDASESDWSNFRDRCRQALRAM